MCYVINLHNMCVEDREAIVLDLDEGVDSSEIMFGGVVMAMLSVLVRLHREWNVLAGIDSFSASRETHSFIGEEIVH